MENSGRPEKIISQAAQWSFEGDCSLLAWMQELSQNLEQRATATNDALQQLSIKVNRTATALDNAANSLTALQYTQFVESRCHDDDETIADKPEVVPVSAPNDKAESSTEVMETFLRKNLEMLHNSHEKYALDFEDSDDDENATANNYIYQPKNPYNDALLPHIYGSKLWKEHWHVGLCDGSNEYSGDEASDAFSESPSSSATDNESYESNTANLSEWASSSSIPIEHKHPAQMPAHGETTTNVAVAAQEKRMALAQRLPSNDDSDTYSTTSRSTTTNPQIRTRDHDLFASLRHESPATSTSVSSSPHKYATPPPTVVGQNQQHQRNIAQASTMLPPFIDAVPPTDIFVDTAAVRQPIVNSVNASLKANQTMSTQSKRKPVNLFDDDDFNSFMSEAVDQPQTKVESPRKEGPIPAARNFPTKSEQHAAPPKTIDLFAESLNDKAPVAKRTTVPSYAIEKPNEIKQRKPINLFDSPEGSPPNDMVFSTESDKIERNVVQAAKPSITAKSLFDDDEDDDDFLNVFGSKKLSLPNKSTGKTLLFDDADDGDEDILPATKPTSGLTSNLFDSTPPTAIVDNSAAAPFKKAEAKEATSIGVARESSSNSALPKDRKHTSNIDLFDDFDDEVAPQTAAIPVGKRDEQKVPKPPAVTPAKKLFSADLFGEDDHTNDLDDMLTQQSPNQEPIKTSVPIENVGPTVESQKLPIKEIIQQKKPLFADEFDDDDDLFGKSLAKEKANEAYDSITNTKVVEKSVTNISKENTQSANKSTVGAFKSAALFADDFDDEDDALFGVKSTTPVLSKSDSSAHNREETREAVANLSKANSLFKNDVESERNDFLSNTAKSFKENTNTESKEPVEIGQTAPLPTKSDLIKIDEHGSSLLVRNTAASAVLKTQAAITPSELDKEPSNLAEQPKESQTEISSVLPVTAKTNVETNTSILHANEKSPDFAEIDLEQPQNDIPVTPTKSETITIPTAEVIQSTPPNVSDAAGNLKYANIFLDEPPDDDDFFTTLTNNSKQMSISKLTLDLENDFYEPALPVTPNTAIGTNSQNDGTSKHEPGSSDYGGLRLFSEIPPDDDGVEDFNSSAALTKDSSKHAAISQRLANVFYDDFSETLAAVQQMKENKKGEQPLFVDEPPADAEQFNIVGKVAQAQQKETKKSEEEERVEGLAKEKPFVFDRDSMSERETDNERKTSASPKDETDRAVQKEAAESQHSAEKTRSAAGKLQMPNLKINVQALLPGGGGRPSFKKTTAQNSPDLPKSTVDTRKATPEKTEVLSKDSSKTAVVTSTSSENLLPNVCKSRVRVPAGRRPSTRRARQENYRKSLIVDQIDFGDEAVSADNSSQLPKEEIAKAAKQFSIKPATEKMAVPYSQGAAVLSAPSSTSIKPLQTNLFVEDDDDNDDFLFNASHTPNATNNNSKQNTAVNVPLFVDNDTHAHAPKEQTTIPAQQNNKSLPSQNKDFFDDAADDLFKRSLHTAPISTNQANTTTTTNTRNITTTTTKAAPIKTTNTKSLFGTPSSEDDDDDLFKSSSQSASATIKAAKNLSQTITTKTTTATSAQSKATSTVKSNNNKLHSIFGSDDDEDDDFLSNLKTKKITTKQLAKSVDSGTKQAAASSGGLFSDIDSDEDDLFGGKSKPKQVAAAQKQANTSKTQLPTTTQKSATSKTSSTSTSTKPPTTLADNPLADLFSP